MNYQLIKNKKAEFQSMLTRSILSIIIGTESWLTPDISTFHLYSKLTDMTTLTKQVHGAVFTSVTSKLYQLRIHRYNTQNPSYFGYKNLTGHQKLLVNSFYIPPSGGENALQHFEPFFNSIYPACSNPNTIVWLGGDYSFPDIDWINITT